MSISLMIILPFIICIAPIAAGGILLRSGKHPAGKILRFLGFVFLTALVCYFILLETNSLTAFPAKMDIAFPLVSFAFIVLSLIAVFFTRCKKSVKAAALVFVLLFTAGVLTGMEIYQHGYYDKYPAQRLNDDLYEYSLSVPNSKTASLSGESTLKLTDDLPIMDGATALYPVYAAFAKAVYPIDRIDSYSIPGRDCSEDYLPDDPLTCYTTTGAYERIVTGDADIIFVAAPSDEQRKAAEDAGVELVYTPIGKEAFVFFVNAENKLDDILITDIQNIYSGKVKYWKELGAKMPGKIIAFQRAEGSGSQTALKRLMGDIPLTEAPKDGIVSAMGGMIEVVGDYRNFKNAIGFSFRFYTTEMINSSGVKLLSVNEVEPTPENIANGTYPISEYFYAVTRSDATENTKKLLGWITGSQGQELVEKTGYIPIT